MLSTQKVLPLSRFLLVGIPLVLLVLLTACNGSTPPAPDKMIYGVSRNGTVFAMSGKDGSLHWSQHMSGDNGSIWGAANGLTVDNGVIYTSSSVSGGYAYAFRAQTGEILWHTQLRSLGVPSAPTLVNGVIYLSATDRSLTSSHVYAFKATDGSLLWNRQIQGCGAQPVLVGGSLYLDSVVCNVADQKGYIYALNASSGSVRWRYQLNWGMYGSLLVLNGIIYTSNGDGSVTALHAGNGSLLWQKQMLSTTISSLAGTGNTLYLGVNTSLYALRASDGKQLWQVRIGNHGPYNPVVIGNTIYAISPYDPGLYALQRQDGAALWNYQTQGYFASSFPLVDNGVLYFSMAGTIFELAANDGTQIASYTLNDSRLWVGSPLVVGP